jgi:nucleotidyltransferase substrate binding protein (TIGR01987 family)
MPSQDIRWKQRFDNFTSALKVFDDAVRLSQSRPLTDLENQGLIQSFEFCHELAWNVAKDFLEHQGIQGLFGSRDTTREAFQKGLISNGDDWMDMIKSRNLSSHTYSKKIAEELVKKITQVYAVRFNDFHKKFSTLATQLDDLNLPYKTDLVHLNQTDNQQLKDHIQRVGIEFC